MRAFYRWEDIIGYEEIKERARALSEGDENILLIGESGVGKRMFASAIHNSSFRKDKPFLTVETPSIQNTLFESELFGHRKGAFTDAKEDRAGLIESAGRGTVFFDEIGDLSLDSQVKILRCIEEKKVRRIGENFERGIGCRFIFATNKDLWKMAKRGLFREDLLYRIEKNVLCIPPLRERRDEIEEIANSLWRRILERNTSRIGMGRIFEEELKEDETEILIGYDFPGNIRQLETILENVFSKLCNKPERRRVEIFRDVIEEMERRWEEEHEDGWHSMRLYKDMKEGRRSFWEVRDGYLRHEINRYQLEEIIKEGLKDGDGSIKGLLSIFGIEERDYKKSHDFLRHQGIKIKEVVKSSKGRKNRA